MTDTPTKRTEKRTETHECDCISRQEVVESFTQLWNCVGEIADKDEWEDVCKTTANELPSAQRKGKWIRNNDSYHAWKCSVCWCVCEDWTEKPTYNYCPNCGALMKGEEDVRESD